MSSGSVTREVNLKVKITPDRQIELPDWVRAGGAAREYYKTILDGSTKAAPETDKTAEAFDKLAREIETSTAEMLNMINTGAKWEELEGSIRGAATQIVGVFDALDSGQKQDAVDQIVKNTKKNYDDLQTAAKKANKEMTQGVLETTNALSQAVGGVSRLIGTIALMSGSNEDIQELARKFVILETAIAAIQAGGALFGNLNTGLNNIQKAASAAQQQIELLGDGVSMTTKFIAGLEGPAVALHAALGPIAIVLALISTAFIAYQALASAWGEDTEDAARRAEKAMADYQKSVNETQKAVQDLLQTEQSRVDMMQTQFDWQTRLQGGALTPDQIRQRDRERNADDAQQLEVRQKEAAQRIRDKYSDDEKQQRAKIQAELSAAEEELAAHDQTLKELISFGRDINAPPIAKITREKTSRVQRARQAAESYDDQLYARHASGELDRVYSETTQADLNESQQTLQEVETQRRLADAEKDKLTRRKEEAQRDYDEEIKRSLALENEKRSGRMGVMQDQIRNQSTFEGIGTISPYLSSDRQQELYRMESQGQLTRDTLLKELESVLDTKPEQEAYDKQIAAAEEELKLLNQKIEALNEIQKSVEQRSREELKRLQDLQDAMRAAGQ